VDSPCVSRLGLPWIRARQCRLDRVGETLHGPGGGGNDPGGELVLRHEAIPDFTDKSGAVVGMDSMVMPFPIPANLSLVGLTPGDKIEFVFSVDWAQSRYLVESIKKLPAETTLKMGKAQAIGSMGSHMLEDAKK